MSVKIEELKDGKLPPDIWCTKGNWYPRAVEGAIHHFEVADARHCSIEMITPSRNDPSKTYRQYYLSTKQMAKNLADPEWLKFHGITI